MCMEATAIIERVSPRGWVDVVHVLRSEDEAQAKMAGDDEAAGCAVCRDLLFFIYCLFRRGRTDPLCGLGTSGPVMHAERPSHEN